MSSTTLLPIGTMIYYKGCKDNPIPDFGIVAEYKKGSIFCTSRNEDVDEKHYLIEWWDGNAFFSTHLEMEQDEFIILEEPSLEKRAIIIKGGHDDR